MGRRDKEDRRCAASACPVNRIILGTAAAATAPFLLQPSHIPRPPFSLHPRSSDVQHASQPNVFGISHLLTRSRRPHAPNL
ncbi:uncharacterized protein SCHCODRAFT_02644879 [Schizophyllum commune H4-8]|uniref:uncharacterized protein n=1 Tax=Schizophyllum commune (strain H4-8 / FGSC 9210) TaxID=578458 RepID=UPI00215E381B|nr:uncharacterized protein SCHCODRAFT_02644879 [Schizophyllum commune H4-8]KAI5885027.1 hypothetical protein SCHCODRAFT_02644879 [Schizophyllum commune H4-8]